MDEIILDESPEHSLKVNNPRRPRPFPSSSPTPRRPSVKLDTERRRRQDVKARRESEEGSEADQSTVISRESGESEDDEVSDDNEPDDIDTDESSDVNEDLAAQEATEAFNHPGGVLAEYLAQHSYHLDDYQGEFDIASMIAKFKEFWYDPLADQSQQAFEQDMWYTYMVSKMDSNKVWTVEGLKRDPVALYRAIKLVSKDRYGVNVTRVRTFPYIDYSELDDAGMGAVNQYCDQEKARATIPDIKKFF